MNIKEIGRFVVIVIVVAIVTTVVIQFTYAGIGWVAKKRNCARVYNLKTNQEQWVTPLADNLYACNF
jgi:hypothetical protein